VGTKSATFRAAAPQLALLALAFFFAFTCRVAFSPLLPSIEADLGLSHARSTSFFLFISLGYAPATLLSGLVSSRIGHRRTILLSLLAAGAVLLGLSRAPSLWIIHAGLVLVGAASGLYLPSGIPTLSSLASGGREGRALAIHELAPNLAYVLIPLAAAALFARLSWRGFLLGLGLGCLVAGGVFLAFGRGGRFRGQPPSLANVRRVLSRRSYWLFAALFTLGVGAGIGVFSILPTYLVSERGLSQATVNALVGLSRISCLAAVFAAGWLADRFGARAVLAATLLAAGAATSALGFARGGLLTAAVFVQPVLSACFFPVGFAAVARTTPRRLYNVTISLFLPVAYALGGGLTPSLLGILGDRGSFALGLVLLGALVAAGGALAALARLGPAAPPRRGPLGALPSARRVL
jgi:NNP family nitrate/nitrite transporter-like MFS transporter